MPNDLDAQFWRACDILRRDDNIEFIRLCETDFMVALSEIARIRKIPVRMANTQVNL